jgi:predicted aldo/keto reductase-like oxidoreductase
VLKRRLGRTDFKASVVGFGGIPIASRSRDEAVKVVKRAIEMGVNFIDTARSYGDSEDKIGEAIRGRRQELFISTKSHYRTGTDVRDSIEESLRRLAVDKVDIIFMHGVDAEADLDGRLGAGVLDAMKEARAAGKVDYIGISGHNNKLLVKAIRTGEFDAIIASYNLTNDHADRELFPLAQELDVGVIVMKPLVGGYLAVPREAVEFKVEDKATSTAEAALRFVLSNPYISTAIPGMWTVEEVEEDVPLGYVAHEMHAGEAEELQERAQKVGYTFCQGCGYCIPECPEGIDPQGVFRLLVFYEQYGMKEWAVQKYREQHEARVALCTECQSCIDVCPAQLDIPAKLKEAAAILGSKG